MGLAGWLSTLAGLSLSAEVWIGEALGELCCKQYDGDVLNPIRVLIASWNSHVAPAFALPQQKQAPQEQPNLKELLWEP